MSTLQFCGVELRAGNWKTEEGGPVHRLKLLADLSKVAARGLGVEDYFFDEDNEKEIREEITIRGALKITEFRLEPNGMKQHTLEIPATDLDWEIYTKMAKSGDDDDPAECRIRIELTTTSPAKLVDEFVRTCGTVACVMKVKLASDPQMSLKEDEDKPQESAGGEPPLASAREMQETARQVARKNQKTNAATAS